MDNSKNIGEDGQKMSLDNYLQQMDYQTGTSKKSELENTYKAMLQKKQISVSSVKYEAKPQKSEDETKAYVSLYWDWVKKEWFATVSGDEVRWYNPDNGKPSIWPFSKGPFRLNDEACMKLLEAYKIPKAKLKLSLVPKTSPRKLERMSGK